MNPIYPLSNLASRSDTYALTDNAEVRECRRVLGKGRRVLRYSQGPGTDPDWLTEAEYYGTADEAALARDLELWGRRPFGLED